MTLLEPTRYGWMRARDERSDTPIPSPNLSQEGRLLRRAGGQGKSFGIGLV